MHKLSLGFTLIEVMLAMAIFSIAGIALLSAADNNFKNLSHLESKVLANWVASNQLVAVTLAEEWPPKNNKKGKVEMAGQEWFWLQKVIKTENKNMRSVVIEVRNKEDQKLAITSMVTYLSKSQL
ncbi:MULTISPECIES: type II secretion system minor pseudopilin GspI [unclassified Colwellia]|nr:MULTISPECIES: type II secretion system minor pseudopilin GspI [unclassified Colwellia]MBA6232846.1 type II secretion system minor pseudopilin GspI [Colwellia sp. MB02u-7]MBA6256685.1 type II secretion system minor pseudopilin GspI [Colwellia sp. MB3u-28]MBA6298534.1 type II secretion system minor pseudopilin GspI [Colwellia sp. MB3u-22]MBA6311641.1 type II secretion system minor pseudopilin GspI [Colwellia sp. MB3u-64]MBA6236061.1 type II secretion system minor pseudopilin GspI [Colwellia s